MRKKSQFPDLFTPDGFVAGQMIVPRAADGRHGRRQDDLRARGLEVPRPEGLAGDPAAGSRDAAADVPGARCRASKVLDGQGARDRLDQTAASDHDRSSRSERQIAEAWATPILATEEPRARHRRRDDRRRCLPRGRPGRVPRRHRAERRRQDVALQPALGPPAADGGARRARRATTSPTSRRSARTRAGLGRTFQVSNVFPLLPVRENVRLAAEAPLGGTLRLWRRAARVREAVERADWALERVGLAPPRSGAGGLARARRQAPARARDGARRRPARDPARRADGRRLGRERPRARRADPLRPRRGEARRC